jgi:hypothetical protein
MRRLRGAADWRWSDHRPEGHSRWTYFARSGEALTSLFLASFAAIFLWPGSTFATAAAFAWLRQLVAGHGGVWVAVAVALAITGPYALWQDSGALRILSTASQGAFFILLANSVRLGAPPSLLAATLVLSGLWLLVRAAFLLRHHWRWGGRRGEPVG